MKIARQFAVTLAMVLLLAAVILTAGRTEAQLLQLAAPTTGPAVGRTAIAFSLQTLDGKTFSLDSSRGKPLVMNFFASWCDPCREEMPLINELAAKADKDGYIVLGIAVEDSRAAVTQYARESKLVFPIALDLNSKVKRAYRIFGPPGTFFIDRQGVIKDVVLGPISQERAKEAMRKIVPASRYAESL